MFKRIKSVGEKIAKRRKLSEALAGEGNAVLGEDEGPRELVLDEDSDSESESDDSESDGGSSSSSSAESASSVVAAEASSTANGKKRAREEESDEDEDDSDSEDESDDELPAGESQPDLPLDPLLRPSIDTALSDPIYIKPNAIEKQGFKHRSCYLCPAALIKTEKMLETHMASGSHGRRLKRFSKYLDKLSEEQKRDPAQGGLDAVAIVERVDGIVRKRQTAEAKHKVLVKQQKKEKKHRMMAAKKERRQTAKAEKLAKKERLRLQYEEQRMYPERFPAKLKLKKDGVTVREAKTQQQKVIAKRHRVMPTKEERKANKKVKKQERASRKAAERRARKAAAEASAQGGGGE